MRLFPFALLSVVCLFANAQVEYDPSEWLTNTIPVLYVNTDGGVPITSKEIYIPGNYYLDPCGVPGVEAFGSAESPLPLEIKGRGNMSWLAESYRKKPYKIKLNKKAALLGMPKSKHWALMAHWEDGNVFLKDESAFELSRRIGLAWTPRQLPVEMVLNGEYMGIYFLTQNVRVESSRVNVTEQADGEVDPYNITGGWLLETDNYNDENQIKMIAGNDRMLRITYKSPEILSDEQKNYLINLITRADSLVYVDDVWSRDWENVIDMDSLVSFYLVNEIVDNIESFSGSCYMHKHRGEDTKLIFGPVWDFGNSFGHSPLTLDCFLYENTNLNNHWIKAIARFPRFQQRVRQVWREKHDVLFNNLTDSLYAFTDAMRDANIQDGIRWERPYVNMTPETRRDRYMNWINRKVGFLETVWNTTDATLGTAINENDASNIITDPLFVDVIRNNLAYVTDGNGNWVAIDMENCGHQLEAGMELEAQSVDGYVATTSTNPTILLNQAVRIASTGNQVEPKFVNIQQPISELHGNEIVKVSGYYGQHALWSDVQMHDSTLCLEVADNSVTDGLQSGRHYDLKGILRLKQPLKVSESDSTLIEFDNVYYVFIPLSVLNQGIGLWGDVNLDGRVNVLDVTCLINLILHGGMDETTFERADINSDDNVDVSDITTLINIILGIVN